MAKPFLFQTVAAVILAAMAVPALAQFPIYQTQGPNGTMFVRPGDGTTGGYGFPTNNTQTFYVPAQPQPVPQQFQPNPSQQNWRQYMPGQGYNR